MASRNPQQKDLAGLSFSQTRVAEARELLSDKTIRRAEVSAINKTLTRVRTTLVRSLTGYLAVKRANLIRRTFIRKAKPGSPTGFVRMMGRPIGAINFKHKERRRKAGWGTKASGTGVRVEVIRGQAIQLRHAFIAKGNYGNVHIVQRDKFGGKIGTREGRFPISTKFSQRLVDLYNASPIKSEVDAFVPLEMDKQFRSQVSRFASQTLKR